MQSYILQVQTGSEAKAGEGLDQLGLQVTCPMRTTSRRNPKNRRKVETIEVPVLPGYIVITGNMICWPAILKLKEVIKPIECSGEPQPVSQALVDYVASLEGIEAQQLPFALKQRVQVLNDQGQPTGMLGTIRKIFGIKKAELQLDQLGTATIELGKLEAA